MSDLIWTRLTAGLHEVFRSNYVSGQSKKSYKGQNPGEYAKVEAYLKGGAEPAPWPATLMGSGLSKIERGRRALVAPEPEPEPEPPPPSWGEFLPPRLPESTGGVRNVSTSAEFRAALLAVSPGEIVRLAPGRYGRGESAYEVRRSGTVAAPITIEGDGAIIETAVKQYASYVRLRNLEIDGSSRSGENGIDGRGGTDVEVYGLHIHDVLRGGAHAQGIFTPSACQRWHIINCVIERCGDPANLNKHLEHGLYLSGRDFLVANVVLRDNTGFGAQVYSDLRDSILTHITAVGSVVHAGFVQDGSSTGNRIVNSVALGNGKYGFRRNSGVLEASHLIAFGNGTAQYLNMSGATLLTSDPLLDANLRPVAASPARGHSDPRYSPGFDLAGNPRSSTPTAGAYE